MVPSSEPTEDPVAGLLEYAVFKVSESGERAYLMPCLVGRTLFPDLERTWSPDRAAARRFTHGDAKQAVKFLTGTLVLRIRSISTGGFDEDFIPEA